MADPAPAAGLPQLDLATFPNQIFWLGVALVTVFFILSRIALPRIGSVLAERAGTIANDLAAAEQLRAQAAEAEAQYNRALDEARAAAAKLIAEAKAEIQADLDAAIAHADAEIAARTAEADARLSRIAAQAADAVSEVARDAASEIVAAYGITADAGAIRAAVGARLGR